MLAVGRPHSGVSQGQRCAGSNQTHRFRATGIFSRSRSDAREASTLAESSSGSRALCGEGAKSSGRVQHIYKAQRERGPLQPVRAAGKAAVPNAGWQSVSCTFFNRGPKTQKPGRAAGREPTRKLTKTQPAMAAVARHERDPLDDVADRVGSLDSVDKIGSLDESAFSAAGVSRHQDGRPPTLQDEAPSTSTRRCSRACCPTSTRASSRSS